MKKHYSIAAIIGFMNCILGVVSSHGIPKDLSGRLLSNGYDLMSLMIGLMIFAYATYWYSLRTLKKLLINEMSVFSLNGYINILLIMSTLMTIFGILIIQDPMQIITQPLLWMIIHFMCGINGAIGLAIGFKIFKNQLIQWKEFRFFSVSMILMSIPAFMMSTIPLLMLMNTPDQLKLSLNEYTLLLVKVLADYHYHFIFEAFRVLNMLTTFTLALVFLKAARITTQESSLTSSLLHD